MAGQASARVKCSGSGAEPPSNVLTLRLSARPCPQTPLPAGMESMAEERESANQSAALGGALRAWLAASLFRLESKSSLAPRAAPETPAGGGATAHRVALSAMHAAAASATMGSFRFSLLVAAHCVHP